MSRWLWSPQRWLFPGAGGIHGADRSTWYYRYTHTHTRLVLQVHTHTPGITGTHTHTKQENKIKESRTLSEAQTHKLNQI